MNLKSLTFMALGALVGGCGGASGFGGASDTKKTPDKTVTSTDVASDVDEETIEPAKPSGNVSGAFLVECAAAPEATLSCVLKDVATKAKADVPADRLSVVVQNAAGETLKDLKTEKLAKEAAAHVVIHLPDDVNDYSVDVQVDAKSSGVVRSKAVFAAAKGPDAPDPITPAPPLPSPVPSPDAPPGITQNYSFGTVDELIDDTLTANGSSEFGADLALDATLVVATGTVKDIRAWIGHSETNPGNNFSQSFTLATIVGEKYRIRVIPSAHRGVASFNATITSGEAKITYGETLAANPITTVRLATPWDIEFVAGTASVTVELSNGATAAAEYVYIDAYVIGPASL